MRLSIKVQSSVVLEQYHEQTSERTCLFYSRGMGAQARRRAKNYNLITIWIRLSSLHQVIAKLSIPHHSTFGRVHNTTPKTIQATTNRTFPVIPCAASSKMANQSAQLERHIFLKCRGQWLKFARDRYFRCMTM